MYPKNAASPERIAIGPVVQISDGAVQTSGCTVRIIKSGVAEGDGGGTTAYSTDGVVLYTPTQAETNYASFILIAKKTGCIPVAVTVVPTLSATAGQAVCADTQKVDVNTIKTQAVTCAAGVTVRADVGAAAAPGSANGMLIGGSNAATTLASLTVSGATTLTGAVTGTNASNDVRGISVNMIKDQSVTCTTGVTFNANVGTTQPVNFTGAGASALVKSDMVDVAGAAVSTSTAQLGVNAVQAGGTAWGSGAITAGSIASDAITAAKVATDVGAEIADAVWDEALSGHSTSGSTGAGLTAAGSAGDPWATSLPGAYGAGTAGKIVGDNLNAPVGTVDTVVDAIKVKTDYLPSATAGSAGGVFIAGSNAATSITTALTANITGNLSGSVGSVTGAVGSVTGAVGSVTGAVGSVAANGITATSIAQDAINAAALKADALAAVADAVHDEQVDGTVTARQSIRLQNSAAAGKLSGAATTTVTLRDLADSKDRLVMTVDANGNRTAQVSRDVS